MNAYYNDGHRAYEQGKELSDNPYTGRPFPEREWRFGWRAAQEESSENEGGKS